MNEETTSENDIFDGLVLEEIDCPSCSVHFAITKTLSKLRHKDNRRFFCPNGHEMWCPPLPKERDEELEDLRSVVEELREQLEDSEDQLAVALAKNDQLTAKRRIFRKRYVV